MHKTVVSDASCFIILEKIGHLELLRDTFTGIITTFSVASEYGLPLPPWVVIQEPTNSSKVRELSIRLGSGEVSAIALALELGNCSLILDDQKARKIAEGLGIDVTGTIGVMVRAKLNGIVPSVKPFLDSMRNTNFRFSEEVERMALIEAGELDD